MVNVVCIPWLLFSVLPVFVFYSLIRSSFAFGVGLASHVQVHAAESNEEIDYEQFVKVKDADSHAVHVVLHLCQPSMASVCRQELLSTTHCRHDVDSD